MTNYKRDYSYRKIWKEHFGPIPRDELGRSYEIHHKDGNNKNNNIENLQCVSLQEHYDIHYAQGDWYACLRIAEKLKMTGKEISDLARQNAFKLFAKGHIFQDKLWAHRRTMQRIQSGTHNFQGPFTQLKKIAEGRHHFIGKSNPVYKQISNGTNKFISDNPNDEIVECPHCKKSGSRPGMLKWHFENCSLISEQLVPHVAL